MCSKHDASDTVVACILRKQAPFIRQKISAFTLLIHMYAYVCVFV